MANQFSRFEYRTSLLVRTKLSDARSIYDSVYQRLIYCLTGAFFRRLAAPAADAIFNRSATSTAW